MPNLVMNYSNDKLRSVTLKDWDGVVVDLTDCTILMTVKNKKDIDYVDPEDSKALLKKTITSIPDPTSGTFSFSITASESVSIGVWKFYYDFKVINISNLQYSTRVWELEIEKVATQGS